MQYALESRGNDSGKNLGVGAPTAGGRVSTLDGCGSFAQMSGFEQRLLRAVLKNPVVSMRSLRGVFPAATEYYTHNAVLEVSVQVAVDASSIVSSPWAKMEAHKNTSAVMVVLNCHDYDPRSALAAVKVLFQHYFKESICRCLVLDPTVDAKACMSQHVFLPTYTNAPVEDVARYLLKDVALSIVQHVNSCIVGLKLSPKVKSGVTAAAASSGGGGGGGDGAVLVFDDVSSVNDGGEDLKKHVMGSQLKKKKGDLLLQLGALDAALISYIDSLVGADHVWSSATLESLAALRYLQRAPLFALIATVNNLFSSLENEKMVWNESVTATLNQLESVVEKMRTDQHKAVSLLKHNLSASPLSRKLLKEVEEPLSLLSENFRRQLSSIRRSFAPDTKDTLVTNMEDAGRNARSTFKQILHISFFELHLYLGEALQQLRPVAETQVALHEREVEIHFKRTELFAEEGNKRGFLESLTVLKTAAKGVPELMRRRIRELVPSLSLLCGCRRKAVHYVVEAAAMERQAKAFGAAICLLVRACGMAGIQLPSMNFREQAMESLVAPHQRAGESGAADSGTGSTVCRARKAQDVPLLMELLNALVEAGPECCEMQNSLASFLLFGYHPFLSRETQQSLMDIIERSSVHPESLLSTPPPLLYSMDVLALPQHLAPKTVPLSGAQFTFIDTGRLKMTLLTLNGKVLPQGQMVWSVGTVGEVELILTNPFRRDLQLTSIALSCRSVATLDEVERVGNDGELGQVVGPLAPSSYVVTGVILPSMSKRHMRLQVQPNMEGYLVVDGVEIRLGQLPLCSTFLVPSPKPTSIPVLQQLPLVSCTLGVNELAIFSGQTIRLPLQITNSGAVPIRRLQVTAHDESCQLDVCTGCKERANATSFYVILERGSLEKTGSLCLEPGNALLAEVTIVAAACNDNVVFQHVVFRATVELPYDPPVAPENVPSAVPVFAVIPRRVQETYLRVFHVPSVAVTSLALSRDRRYVEITVKNNSKVHTMELLCSRMFFTCIPDALVVAGAEYLIPPIEITKVPPDIRHFPLPWVVRELPECHGVVSLDFSIIANEVVCTEPLEDAVVSIAALTDDTSCFTASRLEWRSERNSTSELTFVVPVMKPVPLVVYVDAPWKRAVPLRVRLAMENHLDADVLSGPVDTTTIVGGKKSDGDEHDVGERYEERVEFFAFKTGEHVLSIKLSDLDGCEMTHVVRLQVEHL
ncbi:hypothetical protein DQ04_02721080 [Trypanosoma grayi]|uniref:hypothetical protein n=1 Tax=Trypanosoma grayi TaxID=71804 RepID=UPI0004F41966|nr:hypothetical protein DQ04_02721080 [Trypanosoma grayi]KEG11349.1 hypothetical protein DQ04_02721080 [Trypanosoma grayi]